MKLVIYCPFARVTISYNLNRYFLYHAPLNGFHQILSVYSDQQLQLAILLYLFKTEMLPKSIIKMRICHR